MAVDTLFGQDHIVKRCIQCGADKPINKFFGKRGGTCSECVAANRKSTAKGKPKDRSRRKPSPKPCMKCTAVKPPSEFYPRSKNCDGLSNICRDCEKDRIAARNKLLAEREHIDFPEKKMCRKCKTVKPRDAFNVNRVILDGLNPHCKDCVRNSRMKYNYGLSAEEIADRIAAQGGLCPICRKRKPENVDHCHKTGKLRSILCRKCNTGIGSFDDDPDRLRAAIAYLEMWQSAGNDLAVPLTLQSKTFFRYSVFDSSGNAVFHREQFCERTQVLVDVRSQLKSRDESHYGIVQRKHMNGNFGPPERFQLFGRVVRKVEAEAKAA